MSCFNSCSSRKLDGALIDKILERGQKLRSCVVQSILDNDPFNAEVICSRDEKPPKFNESPQITNQQIRAFLQGDALSREDEAKTLETLRSMSAIDLCEITDRTYRGEERCDCLTCSDYRQKDLNCDLNRVGDNAITKKIKERYKNETSNYLNYVDSLKISINSVVLNEAGDRKVLDNLFKQKAAITGQTFFLEYQVPTSLIQNHKNKSKVDSGLYSGNTVRLCSRRSHQQVITFKQTSIHDIQNLNRLTLEDVVINFYLSCRNVNQRTPVQLGVAKFSFSSFESTKYFVSNQELVIKLNEKTPLVVGGLKLSVQLGCGRLYFGKEFVDAIINNKENAINLDSDDLSSTGSDVPEQIVQLYSQKSVPRIDKPESQRLEAPVQKKELISHKPQSQRLHLTVDKNEPISHRSESILQSREPISRKWGSAPPKYEPVMRKLQHISKKTDTVDHKREPVHQKPVVGLEIPQKLILFGFVYISQAEFSRELLNSYVTCQMFGQDDVFTSKSTAFSSNPVYDLCQQLPVVYDDELLLKLRENFMVLEFFERNKPKDFIVGLSKLNLHHFYLAYRNPTVVKYLCERKVAVVGFDGWEAVVNLDDGQEVGQVQVLLAMGTREQIDNLESERGFKNNTVRARTVPVCPQMANVGIQSDVEQKKEKQEVPTVTQCVQVEASTNTEPEIRNSEDLLDSLQKALCINSSKSKNVFKAHVAVNGALHLPTRRRCKSKRSRQRNVTHEDTCPSAYVTFEDYKNELKITPVIPKTTSPQWDFRCDVNFPVEYLTNSQKFLVFKVWRKSTNTTTTPNMQVDHVIGFATVDLTVLLAGLPSVQGWFNINDLSNKCNGQINIHVTPLECVTKFQEDKDLRCCNAEPEIQTPDGDAVDEPGELLGRALKRKFTELDEITQRLRLRLSKVTNDESDTSNDEIADEFERDINTLCVEDDFDTVDFDKEARSFNTNHVRDVGLLKADQYLTDGRQKIDALLEKLSLLSGENSSRYVSGCSDARLDTEAILSELDSTSRPNLHSSNSFHRDMVEKFGNLVSSETCSVSSECRAGPEGERNLIDNK